MTRQERQELTELVLRVRETAREETTALHALPCDMGEWTRTADNASTAWREFIECLYRVELTEDREEKAKRL